MMRQPGDLNTVIKPKHWWNRYRWIAKATMPNGYVISTDGYTWSEPRAWAYSINGLVTLNKLRDHWEDK